MGVLEQKMSFTKETYFRCKCSVGCSAEETSLFLTFQNLFIYIYPPPPPPLPPPSLETLSVLLCVLCHFVFLCHGSGGQGGGNPFGSITSCSVTAA